jgi:hypothetical protein
MPSSFLSYIVEQRRLKFEDVATDALAHVLRNAPEARAEVRALINSLTPNTLPERFVVDTRYCTQSCGTPDLLLRTEEGTPRAILEAKFTAALTDHQPNGYLRFLADGKAASDPAALLFLVPAKVSMQYSAEVNARVKAQQGEVPAASLIPIHFITWDQVIQRLRSVHYVAPEFDLLLKDLEIMCEIAKPDEFIPLRSEDLNAFEAPDCPTAARMRNFMDLASEIAKSSLSTTIENWGKYGNAWGSTWSGAWGRLANYKAWIGVDSETWSELGKSPIWIFFEDPRIPEIERKLQSKYQRGKEYFVRTNGRQIAIPLKLTEGQRVQVVENCQKQVAGLITLLS